MNDRSNFQQDSKQQITSNNNTNNINNTNSKSEANSKQLNKPASPGSSAHSLLSSKATQSGSGYGSTNTNDNDNDNNNDSANKVASSNWFSRLFQK